MTSRRGPGAGGPSLKLIPLARKNVEGASTVDQERRRFEADVVAREIRELIDAATPVWDKESREYRPVVASDIAILLRRFMNAHRFEQALEQHGVEYSTPQGTGFFTRQEVLDLTNLLEWIAEPADETALFGILRSPMFLIDDATLLALREADRYDLLRPLRNPPATLSEAKRGRCKHGGLVAAGATRVRVHTLRGLTSCPTRLTPLPTRLRGHR